MNSKLHVEAHLTDEALIRFLDGELDRRSSDAATRHLDSCWTCRSKREQLRLAMDRFVRLEEALIDASITAPPRAWSGFQQRLNEIAVTPPPPAMRARQLTQALGLIGAAVACVVWLTPPSSISAREILERSTAADRPRQIQNPLVFERLRVQSAHRVASWSLWNAPQSRKFLQKWDAPADDRLPTDVERLYSANGLDSQHPISAANHSRWRNALPRRKDSVRVAGELVGVLTVSNTRVEAGQIAEAELWVRKSDWHPVGETFRVAQAGAMQEYRLVETAFHVETLDSENARVFEPAPEAVQPAAVPVKAVEPSAEIRVTPAAALPGQNELIAAEIEALALLHEMDADRQDSAQVERAENQIQVSAYAASEDRKLELESHLAVVPHVTATIHLFSESSNAPAAGTQAAVSVAPSMPSESPLFLKQLVQQTGDLDIANRVVSDHMALLRRLCIELEAVKDLEKRFPVEVRAWLPARSLNQLDGLALDHLDAARQVWRELEQNAPPLLSAMEASNQNAGRAPVTCGEWHRPDAIPAGAAERLEDLFARAFTALAGAPANISQQSIVAEVPELRARVTAELAEGCLH